MKAMICALLAVVLLAAPSLPSQAASNGPGGVLGSGPVLTRNGFWEGRIRIAHHYYDLQPDYTTYVTVSGSTQLQCNTNLVNAFSAAIATYNTAQVAYDYYCTYRP